MSTPSKKKPPTVKVVEPKPKYKIGQKAWAISYHKGKPEELFEVEIESRHTTESEMADFLGKKTGTLVTYAYVVNAKDPLAFSFHPLSEGSIYPSFQIAANKFAESFTTLLK